MPATAAHELSMVSSSLIMLSKKLLDAVSAANVANDNLVTDFTSRTSFDVRIRVETAYYLGLHRGVQELQGRYTYTICK